jgi:hypothetical protein
MRTLLLRRKPPPAGKADDDFHLQNVSDLGVSLGLCLLTPPANAGIRSKPRSSIREIKKRIGLLFNQDRVARNVGLLLESLLGDEQRKTIGCAQRQLAILALGGNKRSWGVSIGMRMACAPLIEEVAYRLLPRERCRESCARLMVFKLIDAASIIWRRLKGKNQSPKIIVDVMFADGIEVVPPQQSHAA